MSPETNITANVCKMWGLNDMQEKQINYLDIYCNCDMSQFIFNDIIYIYTKKMMMWFYSGVCIEQAWALPSGEKDL